MSPLLLHSLMVLGYITCGFFSSRTTARYYPHECSDGPTFLFFMVIWPIVTFFLLCGWLVKSSEGIFSGLDNYVKRQNDHKYIKQQKRKSRENITA